MAARLRARRGNGRRCGWWLIRCKRHTFSRGFWCLCAGLEDANFDPPLEMRPEARDCGTAGTRLVKGVDGRQLPNPVGAAPRDAFKTWGDFDLKLLPSTHLPIPVWPSIDQLIEIRKAGCCLGWRPMSHNFEVSVVGAVRVLRGRPHELLWPSSYATEVLGEKGRG